MQLSLFSAVQDEPAKELPTVITARVPPDPKVEKALELLQELKDLEVDPLPELAINDIVRSSTSFVTQTGKLLRFETIAGVEFAIVEFIFRECPIHYPCTVKTLTVVKNGR